VALFEIMLPHSAIADLRIGYTRDAKPVLDSTTNTWGTTITGGGSDHFSRIVTGPTGEWLPNELLGLSRTSSYLSGRRSEGHTPDLLSDVYYLCVPFAYAPSRRELGLEF